MSNFKLGQKVVCVEPIDEVSKGEMYTIRLIREGFNQQFGNCLTLHFEEIKCGISPAGIEWGFGAFRFRPLHHEFAEEVISMLLEQPETIEL